MNRFTTAASAFCLAAAALMPAAAPAQQPAPAAAAPKEDPMAVLAMEAGTWDADITFPNAEPGKQKAKGVQVNRLRSGGMWIINEFSVDGTPYEGTGIWGYDRASGRYSGIWTDNNDQKIRLDDGRWDPAARTMTWSADVAQPDGRHARYLFTEEFKGDTRLFNMVALTRKGEVPLVSMVFTRRKG